MRQDFRELLAIDFIVSGLLLGAARASAVSSAVGVVARTKIDAQAHVLGLAGLGQFGEHVALALFPRRGLEGIIRGLGLPGAIAADVFGDEDHVAGIGRLDRLHPLVGVEAVGIDLVARRGEVVAFAALVNIRRPVEEQADTRLVPRDLLRRGHGEDSPRILRRRRREPGSRSW